MAPSAWRGSVLWDATAEKSTAGVVASSVLIQRSSEIDRGRTTQQPVNRQVGESFSMTGEMTGEIDAGQPVPTTYGNPPYPCGAGMTNW
ncbi:hypothetical protein GCM10022255_100020 [Dactylosporangium darangshiense]|uniref:Uncharacterized protein n=1 Tax=Dactylosporangium darangshiense TaxID=579108 RepID=A0ABP8DRK9_9ACTN